MPLSNVLAMVSRSRLLATSCSIAPMRWRQPHAEYYYESIDMDDALHPQTILAYGLNGKDLPIPNGAPLRLRVERNWLQAREVFEALELVDSLRASPADKADIGKTTAISGTPAFSVPTSNVAG